jgi:hypothetical protein
MNREEVVKNIGPELTTLVDEMIDRAEELEAAGLDPKEHDWSEYKERLEMLNQNAEVRLAGVLLSRPKRDPQKKLKDWF